MAVSCSAAFALCSVACLVAVALASPPLHPRASDSLPSVAILGGGIGGLSAAQELAERGFSVTVYEALSQLGGKARSFGATGTGKDGRQDLPAEHGFRVFAGEYGATRDVMKKIPFNLYSRTNVEQNLVEGRRAIMAAKDAPAQFIVPSSFPRSADDFKVWVDYFETVDKYLQPAERDFFLKRIAIVKSFCTERRFAEFENVTWWEYMHADSFSPQYQNLVQMISGTILAANPRNANAHIVGTLAADIIDRTLVPGDRGILIMLDGPTSDMWIDPWVQHLLSLGVKFQLNTTLTSFQMSSDGSRVSSASVDHNGSPDTIVADVFFSAVPAEKMSQVLTKSPGVTSAAPSLRQIDQLQTAWMVVRCFHLPPFPALLISLPPSFPSLITSLPGSTILPLRGHSNHQRPHRIPSEPVGSGRRQPDSVPSPPQLIRHGGRYGQGRTVRHHIQLDHTRTVSACPHTVTV
jgi:15-cis-phytoene desaturase